MDNLTVYAILISLIPAFGWGIANALQKPIVREIGTTNFIIYRGIILSIIIGLLLIINLSTQVFDLKYLLFGLVITVISYFGLYFLNKGLEKGDVGVVIPISSTRIIISTCVAYLFLNDKVNNYQIAAIFLVFAGIVSASINFKELKNSDILKLSSGIPQAFLAAIFWGVGLPLFSIPTNVLGVYLFTFIVELVNLIIAFGNKVYQEKSFKLIKITKRSTLINILITGILGTLASLFVMVGYSTGKVSIVTTISSSSPLISVLFGVLFLKEKLKTQQYIAGVMIISGVIGIGYFS